MSSINYDDTSPLSPNSNIKLFRASTLQFLNGFRDRFDHNSHFLLTIMPSLNLAYIIGLLALYQTSSINTFPFLLGSAYWVSLTVLVAQTMFFWGVVSTTFQDFDISAIRLIFFSVTQRNDIPDDWYRGSSVILAITYVLFPAGIFNLIKDVSPSDLEKKLGYVDYYNYIVTERVSLFDVGPLAFAFSITFVVLWFFWRIARYFTIHQTNSPANTIFGTQYLFDASPSSPVSIFRQMSTSQRILRFFFPTCLKTDAESRSIHQSLNLSSGVDLVDNSNPSYNAEANDQESADYNRARYDYEDEAIRASHTADRMDLFESINSKMYNILGTGVVITVIMIGSLLYFGHEVDLTPRSGTVCTLINERRKIAILELAGRFLTLLGFIWFIYLFSRYMDKSNSWMHLQQSLLRRFQANEKIQMQTLLGGSFYTGGGLYFFSLIFCFFFALMYASFIYSFGVLDPGINLPLEYIEPIKDQCLNSCCNLTDAATDWWFKDFISLFVPVIPNTIISSSVFFVQTLSLWFAYTQFNFVTFEPRFGQKSTVLFASIISAICCIVSTVFVVLFAAKFMLILILGFFPPAYLGYYSFRSKGGLSQTI